MICYLICTICRPDRSILELLTDESTPHAPISDQRDFFEAISEMTGPEFCEHFRISQGQSLA